MPHLLAPNANFIPESPTDVFFDRERSAACWDMEKLNSVVQEAGYDGIELHDSRLFPHSTQLRKATPEQAQELGHMIVKFHESWVDTADPQPRDPSAARPPIKAGLAMRIGSRVFFPNGPQSLDRLEALETKLGRELDYVMFPDVHGDTEADKRKTKRFPRSAIQPTIDVAAAWGVDSPQGFADELEERGYKAVWDHFHGDRKGKVVEGRMEQEKYLPVLLERGLVRAVHLGLYRNDFRSFDPARYRLSVQEGFALAGNNALSQYPIGETFDLLRQYDWRGNITVEAPLGGIENAYKELHPQQGKLKQADVVDLHQNMNQAVRSHLPHIEWRPAAT